MPSPFASWTIDHASLRVPDLDAAVGWYTEKLHLRLAHTVPLGALTYAFLTREDGFQLEVVAGPGAEDRPPYEDLRSSLKLSGWHHIGFHVANVHETIEALRQCGVTIVSEPHDVPALNLCVAFFADPWGNLIELTHPLCPKP